MDLSRIPEPMRSRLAEQLERLPPEVRERMVRQLSKVPANQLESVLQRTSPMLQKLAAAKPVRVTGTGPASKTGSTTGQAPRGSIFDPHDHYNKTVQRGDRESPPLFVIMFALACAAVFAQTLGWFN